MLMFLNQTKLPYWQFDSVTVAALSTGCLIVLVLATWHFAAPICNTKI